MVVATSGELLASDCWYNWPGGDRVGAAGYLLTAYPQGVTAITDHLTAKPTMIHPDRLDEAAVVAAYAVPIESAETSEPETSTE